MGGDRTTMQAGVWLGADEIVLRDTEMSTTPAGSVRINVEYAGICGTDLAIFAGKHPRAATPLVMGHEIVGTVVGDVPGGPPIGSRVVVDPLISCHRCRACRDGAPHVCRRLRFFGIDAPGGLAEFVDVPADCLIPVPGEVPASRAAWAEPLAVAVHAVARIDTAERAAVLIFGAGPIGLLVALVARHSGAGRVTLVEPNPIRHRVAVDLGFETAPPGTDSVAWFRSTNDDEGADVVVDTAGHPSVAAILPTAVRETGTVVMVAVYKDPPPFDLRAVCFGEHTVLGARVYTRRDFERAVGLLVGDPLGLDSIPAAVMPLSSVRQAFELATSAHPPMKIFLRPGGAA